MKKLKNGQLVTIDNKVYRVTAADGSKLRACYLCSQSNRPIPCGGRFNYEGKMHFWHGACVEKLPANSYLKPIRAEKQVKAFWGFNGKKN